MTSTEGAPVYTSRFWAKSEPRNGYPKRVHLLEHHLADVGACFEALLAQPTVRKRLAHSGNLGDLDETLVARLSVLAALHDIGKVNVGFQTQIWRDADLPAGQHKPHRAGHTLDLTPVLSGEDDATAKWFFDWLGWWWDAAESWDDRDGETVCALLVATLSHHGLPLQLKGKHAANPAIWRSYGNLDPVKCIRHIGELVREWFPAGWEPGALPLPSTPEFQHMFLGLCTLADWIGSNEAWFRFCGEPRNDYMDEAREKARDAVKAVGLDLHEQRHQFAGAPDFGELFPHIPEPPNAIQRAAAQNGPADEHLVIIESETGSGKTEAALWRFAHMYARGLVDGLYFALPTRAAATQLHGRVGRFVERMFSAGQAPEVVLAVPGYLRAGDIVGQRLHDYQVWWDDHPDDATRHRRWAAESAKRYLAAQIAVGTVDQAMMATLKVKHAHMRAACLARNLLVVDEVHASDTYMRYVLKALLGAHLDAGGYALLMSATLGSAARQEWLTPGRLNPGDIMPLDEAIRSPYPAISTRASEGERVPPVAGNDREKTVHIRAEPLMHDFDVAAKRALRAACVGAKVLVVRNTVSYAVGTQQAAETAALDSGRNLLFSCRGVQTLHHGRFAADDRRLLDCEVEKWLVKDRGPGGIVVVGTQTLEQSLDIDADLLITDLCPMDVLLQRIGRLHRHQRGDRPALYKTPTCIVLTPEGEDLSPLLLRGSNRNGLGPHGYVYEDLRVLEATRRLIGRDTEWSIPRMNRDLVERATHPEALEAIVCEMGDDWRVHANHVMGGGVAKGLTARSAIIRRDKSFFTDNHDVLFPPGSEENIRTRLGDEGIEVQFDPAPLSPFDPGRTIDRMAVPARWLVGATIDDSVAANTSNGGFTFTIGSRRFRYDRLGLRLS